MEYRALRILLALLAVVAVLVIGLGDSGFDPACLNEYMEPGSDLKRYCAGERPADSTWLALALVVVVAGAVLASVLPNGWVLLGATCVALLAAQAARPEAPTGPGAIDGPERVESQVPPPAPVVRRPVPGENGLPPDQAAAARAQSDAQETSRYVAMCIRGGERPRDCADPDVRNDGLSPEADLDLEVYDRYRWRIRTRTRGVRPAHTYTMRVDLRNDRIVHTCAPRGTIVCIRRGRRVEELRPPGSGAQLVEP
ncbi:MAG TPA: hypothetical protein VF517_14095 [Thermoleophilaceae bacterium]|jgi:hypothetical protein